MNSIWHKLRTELPLAFLKFVNSSDKSSRERPAAFSANEFAESWDDSVERDRLSLVDEAKKALVLAGYKLTKNELKVLDQMGPTAAAKVRTTLGTYRFPSERKELCSFLISLKDGTFPVTDPDRKPWLVQP